MAHNGDGTLDDFHDTAFIPGILAVAYSFDPGSDEEQLIDLAVVCAAGLGTDVTILDVRDLELPSYVGGAGGSGELPQGAYAFRQLICAHDGFLIALPSDDGDCSPLLMNAIAWSVCPEFGVDSRAAYTGKCATLMSGADRSRELEQHIADLTASLSQLGVLVLPEPLATTDAALPDQKDLVGRWARRKLEDQMNVFVRTIRWAQGQARLGSSAIEADDA